jgi:O-acetyl-ADP-ribose deacetylase (regulator of RNase III)
MDRYPALPVGTKNEIEYQEIPPLKVSSIGTKNKPGKMPNGSALLTDTGKESKLKKNGINWIIHAVPQKRSNLPNNEEFIKIAVKACQNSIILADREGIKKLAICFIAGKIYRGNCPPEEAAEAIIIGGLNQIESCENLEEIIFVAYDNEKNYYEPYLIDAFEKIKKAYYSNSKKLCRAKAVRGDICHKNIHESEAIVNSENAEME